jgi:hypothetical protein
MFTRSGRTAAVYGLMDESPLLALVIFALMIAWAAFDGWLYGRRRTAIAWSGVAGLIVVGAAFAWIMSDLRLALLLPFGSLAVYLMVYAGAWGLKKYTGRDNTFTRFADGMTSESKKEAWSLQPPRDNEHPVVRPAPEVEDRADTEGDAAQGHTIAQPSSERHKEQTLALDLPGGRHVVVTLTTPDTLHE